MSVPADSATYVADIITDVLAYVAAALVTAGRSVDRLVTPPGAPAWDCALLAVWPDKVRHAGVGTQQAPGPMMKAVVTVFDCNVTLLRCVTALLENGDIPSADTVTDEGVGINTDLWVVHKAITRGKLDGSLFSRCSSARIQPTTVLTPSGGLGGIRTTIEVTI